MHDYHKAKDMVEAGNQKVTENGKSKVTKFILTVGESSGYSPDSILMYFQEVAQGTVCEGAEVIIHQVKPTLECPECGEVFPRKMMEYACPKCGAEGRPGKIGTEVIIEAIEIQ